MSTLSFTQLTKNTILEIPPKLQTVSSNRSSIVSTISLTSRQNVAIPNLKAAPQSQNKKVIKNEERKSVVSLKGIKMSSHKDDIQKSLEVVPERVSDKQNEEGRMLNELFMTQLDFEKKFIKCNENCLNKCEQHETWKYEGTIGASREIYVVKKYNKLDESKCKKLVSSYTLQYSMASQEEEESLFIRPYKLVKFFESEIIKDQKVMNQNNLRQSNFTQSPQQRIKWHFYVIYPFKSNLISAQRLFENQFIELQETDILFIAVQLFKIGQKCAENNFPLINWKFSNLLLKIKEKDSYDLHHYQHSFNKSLEVIKNEKERPQKIDSSSVKMMDIYDYLSIANRDLRDPLVPPELISVSDAMKESSELNLEQSSIFMTGMIIALLLRKIWEQQNPEEYKINQLQLQAEKVGAQYLPSSLEIANKKYKNEKQQIKRSLLLLTGQQDIINQQKQNEQGAVQSMNSIIDTIIEKTSTKQNQMLHTLAMIIKEIINPNPKERPTFSNSLEVLKSIFGEAIDYQFNSATEKKVVMYLELSNSLLSQSEIEGSQIALAKANYFIQKQINTNKEIPICFLAFRSFTTGNILLTKGITLIAVKKYNEALRDLEAIDNPQLQKEKIYQSLYPSILLQLGIISHKMNQHFKALMYLQECLKILEDQSKNIVASINNSKKLKQNKMFAQAFMWKALSEMIVGAQDISYKISLKEQNTKEKSSSNKQDYPEIESINQALKYTNKNTFESQYKQKWAQIKFNVVIFQDVEVSLAKAKILNNKGDSLKAMQIVDNQLEILKYLNQNKKYPCSLTIECNFVRGVILFQKNKINEAIESFQKAKKAFEDKGEQNHPDCSPIFQKLAKCYARIGNISQASSLHERAIQLQEKPLRSLTENVPLDSNLLELTQSDSRFFKQQTEEPESILMYNYCLHLKEIGQLNESKEFSLQLIQNNQKCLSPNTLNINQLLNKHYSSIIESTTKKK